MGCPCIPPCPPPPNLSCPPQVLRALGYVAEGGAVALGGRLASLLSTHELVLTELLLGNVLAPLRPEESVALLSCMVCQGRGEAPPHVPPALHQVLGFPQVSGSWGLRGGSCSPAWSAHCGGSPLGRSALVGGQWVSLGLWGGVGGPGGWGPLG